MHEFDHYVLHKGVLEYVNERRPTKNKATDGGRVIVKMKIENCDKNLYKIAAGLT